MEKKNIVVGAIIAVFLISLIYTFFFIYTDYNNEMVVLDNKFESELDKLQQNFEEKFEIQQQTISTLEEELNITKQEQQKALSDISSEITRVEQDSLERAEEFEKQLGDIEINSQVFSSSVINDVIKSVVSLQTDQGLGSGVVVDEGYLVTNHHVIEDITQLSIIDVDGEVYAGRLVAYDEDADLALLYSEDLDLPSLKFETDEVEIGDRVIALGNPGGLSFSVTEGIVSAVNREFNDYDYVQTDVSINPGNSGGPLVNLNKKIVGINTFKIRDFEGVGFALNSETLKDFVDEGIAGDQE